MIETFKILTRKYDALVSPTLNTARTCITTCRGNDLRLQKIDLNTIYGNTVSLTGLLTYGTVYLITLYLPTLLMYLRTDYR